VSTCPDAETTDVEVIREFSLPSDLFPVDHIEQRSKEIDDLFEQGNPEQAMKRPLDFARDFGKQRETIITLNAISKELKRIKKESDDR
jgi:hypothetical protein